MEQLFYKDKPQVNTGFRDLINAIILRSVQDCVLKNMALNNRNNSKEKIKKEAIKFIKSEQFKFMCECVDKDWKSIENYIEGV